MSAIHYQNFIEGKAHALRLLANVSTFGRLEPFELAGKMEIEVLTPQQIPNLPSEILDELLVQNASGWSAGTIRLPSGKFQVVMNPTHQMTRQRVTLMEELSHIHLGHRPSQITSLGDGISFRSFDKQKEREAYSVGAAALLPRRVLKGSHTLNKSFEQVADEHGVSFDLLQYRLNMVRLSLRKEAIEIFA